MAKKKRRKTVKKAAGRKAKKPASTPARKKSKKPSKPAKKKTKKLSKKTAKKSGKKLSKKTARRKTARSDPPPPPRIDIPLDPGAVVTVADLRGLGIPRTTYQNWPGTGVLLYTNDRGTYVATRLTRHFVERALARLARKRARR